MSGHSFAARLFTLRDRVLGWPRTFLAERIRQRAAILPPDDSAELARITAEDIRSWEKGIGEPTAVAKRIIAKVLGFSPELLDPQQSSGGLSPQGLLELTRARGLKRDQVRHYWSAVRRRARFKGNPSRGEWIAIIQQLTASPQGTLFDDGVWCTHCGQLKQRDETCEECGFDD